MPSAHRFDIVLARSVDRLADHSRTWFGALSPDLTRSVSPQLFNLLVKRGHCSLKEKLTNYIDDDLKTLVIDAGGEPKHTAGFQRVVRAAYDAEGEVVLTGPAQSFLWRYSPRQRAPPRGCSVRRT